MKQSVLNRIIKENILTSTTYQLFLFYKRETGKTLYLTAPPAPFELLEGKYHPRCKPSVTLKEIFGSNQEVFFHLIHNMIKQGLFDFLRNRFNYHGPLKYSFEPFQFSEYHEFEQHSTIFQAKQFHQFTLFHIKRPIPPPRFRFHQLPNEIQLKVVHNLTNLDDRFYDSNGNEWVDPIYQELYIN